MRRSSARRCTHRALRTSDTFAVRPLRHRHTLLYAHAGAHPKSSLGSIVSASLISAAFMFNYTRLEASATDPGSHMVTQLFCTDLKGNVSQVNNMAYLDN